jgi:hypothetical protein
MMKVNITAAQRALMAALLALCPPTAAYSANSSAAAAVTAPAPKVPFIPPDFRVPAMTEADDFQLVPLGPALVKIDYDAYMSSIEHLQKTFTRSTDWPRVDITDADAMVDMQTEQGRYQRRESFAYAVLTSDGSRERGSVYVSPSPVAGYDAVVRMWVTKAEYDAGFDAQLYAWVTDWVKKEWPFKRVAYPGRAIEWAAWDAMVAAKAAK